MRQEGSKVEMGRNITFDLIEKSRSAPNDLAVIIGRRSMSYSDLNGSVWGAANYLQDKGVRPGDIVALAIADQFSLVWAYLGIIRLGATALVLAPNLTTLQRDKFIADSAARHIFTDDVRYTDNRLSRYIFDENSIQDKSASFMLVCEFPKSNACIAVGSGSTGNPHLIPSSHEVIKERNKISKSLYDLKPGRSLMLVSPFHFAIPMGRLLEVISAGATCVMWDQNSPLLQAIHSAQPDVLNLTVFHAELMLRQVQRSPKINLSGIQIVSIAASTVSENLRHRMKEMLKANLHIVYGTNETFTLSIACPDDLIDARDSIGRPPDGVRLEIVDRSGVPVPEGEVGEIRAKTPACIDGYLDGSDSDRFLDGWFYPRDLGRWNRDGQLIYCGRADQMMILDGMNIFPAEIEAVLCEHQMVEDVAVFPLKDPVRQDVPVCMVSLKAGAHADLGDLQAYARERLGLRTPRHILVAKKLPRNEQGKLIRPELERRMHEYIDMLQRQNPVSPRAVELVAGASFRLGRHRQSMRTRELKFRTPGAVVLEPLDEWIPYLRDASLPCEELEGLTEFQPETELVARWFQRVLALTKVALLAANIPCFEQVQLLKCTLIDEQKRVFNAVVALPEFENYTPSPLPAALRGAISCARYMQENPPNDARIEEQFREIERRLLDEIRKSTEYSSINLRVLHTAYRIGIPFWHLGSGVYQLGWGSAAKLIDRSTSSKDSAISNKLTKFKSITTGFLRDAGLPVPLHALASNLAQARETAERIGWPVVIKPNDLERGEGVQIDVRSQHLEAAFQQASDISKRRQLLVERQVSGVCHRLFFAGGKLLYAVKRLPIGVYGDGVQTIVDLVKAASAIQRAKPPWRRSKIPLLDDLGQAAIRAQGFTEASVPEQGVFVALRRIESTKWGGVDEEVTNLVHPENLRIARVAAELCGLDVAGVDIITDQISESWVETGAIINEVNYLPSLGGGEVSRRHLPEYLNRVVGSDGRIPVDVFVGDEQAFEAGKARADLLKRQGTAVYFTSGAQTFGPSGREIPIANTGLRNRVRALVLNRDVEALVLVLLNDSDLDVGLPLEGVDAVHYFGEPNLKGSGSEPTLSHQNLVRLLSAWVWPRN
jgi:cyanophycin synthetase